MDLSHSLSFPPYPHDNLDRTGPRLLCLELGLLLPGHALA